MNGEAWVSAGLSADSMWHFTEACKNATIKTVCGLQFTPVVLVKTGRDNPPRGLHCVTCNPPLPFLANKQLKEARNGK